MNNIIFLLTGLLIYFVHGNSLYKTNFYSNVYKNDPQCTNTKQLAYEGISYKSNLFSLQLFFLDLKTKNCSSSLIYECKNRNFVFSTDTALIYNFYCNKVKYFELCSKPLVQWTKLNKNSLLKLSSKDLVQLLYKLFKNNNEIINNKCIIIPLSSSFEFIRTHNISFTEYKSFGLFVSTWELFTNANQDKAVKR